MLLRAALRWCLRLSCQGTVWQHWQHTHTCHVSAEGEGCCMPAQHTGSGIGVVETDQQCIAHSLSQSGSRSPWPASCLSILTSVPVSCTVLTWTDARVMPCCAALCRAVLYPGTGEVSAVSTTWGIHEDVYCAVSVNTCCCCCGCRLACLACWSLPAAGSHSVCQRPNRLQHNR
jgi:hypothetical protein